MRDIITLNPLSMGHGACNRGLHDRPNDFTPANPMRSKLFVPGARPELFDKAMRSEADAISIDLEDAVPENRKAEARAIVGDWLHARPAHSAHKRVIVRVNAMDTPHFAQDVAAVVQPGLDVLNLPKPARRMARNSRR